MLRFAVLLFAFFISCQQREVESAEEDTEPAPSVLVDTIQEKEATEKVVVSNKKSLPTIDILFAGTFHADEVEENAEHLPWLGLFADENGAFVLAETKIIAQRVVDGLLDDEEKGEKTGWEITTESGQHPTMLISGGNFDPGKVEAVELPATIYPGDSVEFDFGGVQYLLYATGSTYVDSLAGMTRVSEYNLYVVRADKTGSRRSSLVSHASFDDAMTSILWAGDVDRDGYMDFLIDMSSHYNQRLPTLFLSSPAQDDQVVVRVAEHSSVGC